MFLKYTLINYISKFFLVFSLSLDHYDMTLVLFYNGYGYHLREDIFRVSSLVLPRSRRSRRLCCIYLIIYRPVRLLLSSIALLIVRSLKKQYRLLKVLPLFEYCKYMNYLLNVPIY